MYDMGYRKQPFALDEYYHLYSRGVEKRVIFLDEEDHNHFLFLMHACNTQRNFKVRDLNDNFDKGEPIVSIGAYCLMPNHFHILTRERIKGGISTYMRKLLTGYAMYFNKKYERTGRLFESTFKSSYAGTDRYLKYLYAYIHLNPAKLIDKSWKEKRRKPISDLLQFSSEYRYSSLCLYLGQTQKIAGDIIDPANFPPYFKRANDHKAELFSWLSYEV